MAEPEIVKVNSEEQFSGYSGSVAQPTVFDLSGLEGATSRLLQSLLPVAHQAILASPPASVREALKISGLDKVFQVVDTIEEGLTRARALIASSKERAKASTGLHERAQSAVERSQQVINRLSDPT